MFETRSSKRQLHPLKRFTLLDAKQFPVGFVWGFGKLFLRHLCINEEYYYYRITLMNKRRELITARKTSHENNNKDPNRRRQLLPGMRANLYKVHKPPEVQPPKIHHLVDFMLLQ